MTWGEGKPWTADELRRARTWRARGYSFSAIDRKLDRTVGSTRQKFNQVATSNPSERLVGSMRAPPDVLEERDRRAAAAELRTQTQEFFGDPPPGYSALDRARRR
jgi:hypothetical protein